MSTKNNPGAFRCYEAALPDEHVFTILARDPAGPATLRFWATERERVGKTENPDDRDRIDDARRDALLMEDWREANLDPLGDGGPPSWKLCKVNDEDGGPIRTTKDPTVYVPAERDGNEAVRINVEWLTARTRDLVEGRMSREEYTQLIELACQSPDRRNPVGSPSAPVADYSDQFREEMQKPETPLYGRNETAGERVVIDTDPDDLAHAPEVPPHRFSIFHKGEQYAYARGLEINPTHLPTALDAMAKDGWHLLAIFGQTDSQHVGFIFERGIPTGRLSGLEIAHGFGGPSREELERRREGPQYARFMSGEPLDDIRAEDPPVAEALYEPFVIEYATRDSDGNCTLHRTPFDHWPLWAQPCGDRGRGQMP